MKQVLFIFCLLVFFSCKKDRELEESPDLGYDYFPVTMGKYIVYDVDSTVYYALPNEIAITTNYRIKEVIDSVFKDNQNRDTYRITRYKKDYSPTVSYDDMDWVIKDVWMANKTSTTAEVVEEDTRYIKLTFPTIKNSKWNGNAQNTIGDWQYKYTEVDKAISINGLNFDKTLTIQQKVDTPAIYYKFYQEKYAKGIGMIYKEISDYNYKIVSGTLFPGQIYQGVSYKMTVVDYHL
ncbi:MAG: hypothetical protein IPG89_14780 [Bacteroidetes bacterium]|nr:hypothetical protein [Bacteroidota bacterium]